MRNKKAAMEMSVGTIVTIVLLVSVLILGIFLVQKIFSSAKGAVDLTDEALTNEINKLFSEDKKVAIYPPTRKVQIEQEESDDVGILIKNLIRGGTGNEVFSYQVSVDDRGDCRETVDQIAKWIILGSQGSNIQIPSGESALRRVSFRIPSGNSLCEARFTVNVLVDGNAYQSEFFDIEII